MLRLHSDALSPAWFEFLLALIRDLEPLGHFARVDKDGALEIGTINPLDRGDRRYEDRWRNAHDLRHGALLRQHRDEILAFEAKYPWLFVDMSTFQPSAVRPELEIVDFRNPAHAEIVEYLKLYQSVTTGRAVGRRMGLLIWDVGQGFPPRLFGAAILASARFFQGIRDARLGWAPDFPKTSKHHDPAARAIRLAGLERIMQLSLACALPPYNQLSGAWLAALTPFTAAGLEAFRGSLKNKGDPNADLAAVATTTGMAVSGTPFRGHRIGQLAPQGTLAAPDASGDIYSRGKPSAALPPLRASFEGLVSVKVWEMARALFAEERPEQFARLRNPDRSAMAYALRRLGFHRSLFQGNDMGVHLGVLGPKTLEYLRSGAPRPAGARPLLDWNQVVDVWARRFLPAPTTVGESAKKKQMADHR